MVETYQYKLKVDVTDADQLISLPVLRDLNINVSLATGNGADVAFSFDGVVDADSKILLGGSGEYIKMPKSIFLHLKCPTAGKTSTVYLTGNKQFKS
jgi:hypothetical protein